MDIRYTRYKYTWREPTFNGQIGVYEKLDRVFSNNTWKMQFSEAHVKVLTRLDYLDHHPILVALSDNVYMRVPISLKFECAWVVEDSYEDMIK